MLNGLQPSRFADYCWFDRVIDCEIEAIHDGGDHDIVVGRVLQLSEVMESKEPLFSFKEATARSANRELWPH